MKDIINVFPELKGIILDPIRPTRFERYYAGVRVVSLFRETLLEADTFPEEIIEFAVRSIAGYLELPTLPDTLTDAQRKHLKMTGSPLLSVFLSDTKLHRTKIASMICMLDIFEDEIELTPQLQITKEEIRKVVDSNSAYDAYITTQRLSYVLNVVTPFVRCVCVNYIKSKI